MNANEKLLALREEWMKTDNPSQLIAFAETEEWHQMSYIEQNRGFITMSKIRQFVSDEWTYKLKYHDEMPVPFASDAGNKALNIGSAFDEKITYGDELFDRRYVVLERTVDDIEEAILDCERRIEEAQTDLKKDGTRSATGIKSEASAKEKIEMLRTLQGKTQLTRSDYGLILQMQNEWIHQVAFMQHPMKKTIFFRIGKIPCKAELDDYELHFTDELVGAKDLHAVRDAKTCADIITFKPDGYLDQMSWYQFAVEEEMMMGEMKWDGRPVCAIIEALDKHPGWSRSQGYYFSPERLRDRRGYLIEKAKALWDAEQANFFVRSNEFRPDSPYYGVDGYGRSSKLVIV